MVTPSLRGHPGKPPGPALGFFAAAFPSPQQLPEVVLKKTGWLGRGPSGSAVRGPKMWSLHPPKSCREPHPGLLSQTRVQGPSQGSPGPGFAEGWPEQLGVRGRMGGTRIGGNRNAIYDSFEKAWGSGRAAAIADALWEGRMGGGTCHLGPQVLPAPDAPRVALYMLPPPLPASPLLTQPAAFYKCVGK